jgi:hypothetical protein
VNEDIRPKFKIVDEDKEQREMNMKMRPFKETKIEYQDHKYFLRGSMNE